MRGEGVTAKFPYECCGCGACCTALARERISEGHVSVRFGDIDPPRRAMSWTISLNGIVVTQIPRHPEYPAIYEAMAGVDGWIVESAGRCSRCGCCQTMEITMGSVEIRYSMPVPK